MPPTSAAIPILESLPACGSFELTVSPFLPQLAALPARILDSISSKDDLVALYLSTNPLVTTFAFVIFSIPIWFILSEINKNYSQFDRMWPILPLIYTAHYTTWAHMTGLPTEKLDNILGLVGVWSVRLTFNYWRRGGYSIGSEDYRWAVLREKIPHPLLWFLFNVTFISFFQNVILFLITSPVYVFLLASKHAEPRMDTSDLVFSRIMLILVVIEWFSDQQQWNYQNAKYKYLQTAKVPPEWNREDLDRGFCTSGLWFWSRHPNFACEQSFWVMLYIWSTHQTLALFYFDWTIAGPIALICLFRASAIFQESITAPKYSEYKHYQERVNMFLPSWQTGFTGPVPAKDPRVRRTQEVTAKPPEVKKKR